MGYVCDSEVCTNCVMMLANGDIGDHGNGYPGMRETDEGVHIYNRPDDDQDENPNSRHAALMEKRYPSEDGWHMFIAEGEAFFSHSSCDGCGVNLGGDRHPVTIHQRSTLPPSQDVASGNVERC